MRVIFILGSAPKAGSEPAAAAAAVAAMDFRNLRRCMKVTSEFDPHRNILRAMQTAPKKCTLRCEAEFCRVASFKQAEYSFGTQISASDVAGTAYDS